MAKVKKVYVVWQGRQPGLYHSWADCAAQVNGYPGAKYKAFPSEAEARAALADPPDHHIGVKPKPGPLPPEVIRDSISVDAACNGSPGDLEYRGVHTDTREELFHVGPLPNGTNNLGEFLAIVHALARLQKEGKNSPVYSDSRSALSWVKNRRVKSTLPRTDASAEVWSLVDRALDWLQNNSYPNPLLKWNTEAWGEIRADFGRK